MATPETGIVISDAVSFQIKIGNDGTVTMYKNINGVWVADSAVAIKLDKLSITTELNTGDNTGITENFNVQDGAKRIKKLQVVNGIVTKLEVENA
jgi:hypothetical protein